MRLIDADAYAFPGDLIYEPTVDAVVLPCKIGDTVYYFYRYRQKYILQEYLVDEITLTADGLYLILKGTDVTSRAGVDAESFGECVFLTREEAEAALAKMG